MKSNKKRSIRFVLILGILLPAIFFITSNGLVIAGDENKPTKFERQAELPMNERDQVAPPSENITVFTSHLGAGAITAFAPNGSVLYYNSTHDGYWDVDPSPEGRETVVYAATDKIRGGPECPENTCISQHIERTNLTTGETEILYSQLDEPYHASEWHDIERISDSEYLIADMANDRVYIVNISTKLVTWEWRAQNYYNTESGGPYPSDWTHLNDVEVLQDGSIMVSLRNLDSVIFLNQKGELQESRTLGSDGNHDILYEQHNPDYIPESQGGPAVLIADSENNRIIEYQRSGNEWKRSWIWKDVRLQWARDADRLPNGNTLITDTHGGRLIEVSPNGSIIWEVQIPSGYDAERLGTGPESHGGSSADKLGLQSIQRETKEKASSSSQFKEALKSIFPSKVKNGIAAITPWWFSTFDLLSLLTFIFSALCLVVFELIWSPYRLRSPITRD